MNSSGVRTKSGHFRSCKERIGVTFHELVPFIEHMMIRTGRIAILLAEKAGLSVDETVDLARAALAKFDL